MIKYFIDKKVRSIKKVKKKTEFYIQGHFQKKANNF